jgi:hypothetical protein
MENQSHPEPTGEKRGNAGDQAGNEGCTQGVHNDDRSGTQPDLTEFYNAPGLSTKV